MENLFGMSSLHLLMLVILAPMLLAVVSIMITSSREARGAAKVESEQDHGDLSIALSKAGDLDWDKVMKTPEYKTKRKVSAKHHRSNGRVDNAVSVLDDDGDLLVHSSGSRFDSTPDHTPSYSPSPSFGGSDYSGGGSSSSSSFDSGF